MKNEITLTLETKLIAFATTLQTHSQEAIDIFQYYWGTSVNTLIGALATGSTAATTYNGGGLTKDQFIAGIGLCEQLNNFFGNAAVTNSAYLSVCDTLRNGSSNASPVLSNDVENIGSRLKTLGQELIQLDKDAAVILKAYSASGLSAIAGSISSSVVIYGCNLTQARFVSGIVLVEQLKKLLNNESVTTGDYQSTVTNLVLGS